MTIEPDELIVPATDPTLATWPARLAAYWVARDRFIESGRDVRPSPHLREMLAQVREPLLAVLRISPDFRPAYDPLLAMATALAHSDLAGARQLSHRAVADPAGAGRSLPRHQRARVGSGARAPLISFRLHFDTAP